MIENIESTTELLGLARRKSKLYEFKTVSKSQTEDFLSKGWEIEKQNNTSDRIKKEKVHSKLLEDRVWTLMFKMGFDYLSNEGGAILVINPKIDNSLKNQIDVVAFDDDVALAIECKSAEKFSGRPQFQEELGKHVLIRERFPNAINSQYKQEYKRQSALIMWHFNISLSENDKSRAKLENVVLLDEDDLKYYEKLVTHLGPAAKYQFLADIFQGKKVKGLEIRVPAVKSKMGGTNCYTFAIPPEYLLKVAYISHRAKGRASDVNTYQRMINKSRLSKIKEYISEDGIFPTNIVLNFEKNQVQFEKSKQETDRRNENEMGVSGWLKIRPTYKSAWIIDGQHRLFAYSGHEKSEKSRLSVLAFEGLAPSKQAQLFVDINAKQKSVKQSLLQELYAELHWDSEEPKIRVRAMISKAVQELGDDRESPLYQRIQTADATKDSTRCISVNSMFGTLEKTGFHITKIKNGSPIDYGPLWAGETEQTFKRTVFILKNWLSLIKNSVPDWWEKGSAEGGGLAMNDGIITCLNILRSVFQHLESSGKKLVLLDNDDLWEVIKRYGIVLGEYFKNFNEEDRKKFRDLRGVQGQTTRTRRCEQAINEKIVEFNPNGLEEFIKNEKANTNLNAKKIIDFIETSMQKSVLEFLKLEYGNDESEWWIMGVPKQVRLKATERLEQDDNKRGGKEYYFDLMDYKKIILDNWSLFEKTFAYSKTGNKDAKTSWLNFVNEKRNEVAHPSSAITLSIEELTRLEKYEIWLKEVLNKLTDSLNDNNAEDIVSN